MREYREWWLNLARGIPVGQKIKVKHPQDGAGKVESVSVGNNATCYWVKCYRRGQSDAVFKDAVNLAEITKAQEVSAKSDLPNDLEPFDPTGNWIHQMAVDYLLKRNLDPTPVAYGGFISPSRMRLIYKAVDTRGNIGYIGRDITEAHRAKAVNYYYEGTRLINSVLDTGNAGAVILVEDINSMFKVGLALNPERYLEAVGSKVISLNGTSGSASLTLTCADEDVVIWLDGDEAGERGALKLFKELQLLSKSVKIVVGEGDPKDYTYQEIQDILWATKCSVKSKIEISEVL